jgi:hypothetical protein
LFIYGPGQWAALNVQRKIIKQGSYKNYRLDGEFIRDNPERFRSLSPGDFVVFDFTGDLYPTSARAVFVAKSIAQDATLHNALNAIIGLRKMVVISSAQLAAAINTAGVPDSHPINELTLESALMDAAQEGLWGQQKLFRRRSGTRLSKEQLQKAREKAADIGRNGEEWVNLHLSRLRVAGNIAGFEWSSSENAVSPYDFRVTLNSGEIINIDAKATLGGFESRIHISLSELYQMKDGAERYDLYRVFNIGESSAQISIAEDARAFAEGVLRVLESMPEGATADSISVVLSSPPADLNFGAPILIEQADDIAEE